MEAIAIVASAMGIMTFVGTCLKLFAKLLNKLHRVPDIIQLVLEDLKTAGPMLKQAGETLHKFPFELFQKDNSTLSLCESYVRTLSIMAQTAEDYRKVHNEFPHDMTPELEERKQTLGLGIDSLKKNLRLLERRKTALETPSPMEAPRNMQRPASAPPVSSQLSSRPASDSYPQPYPPPHSQYLSHPPQPYYQSHGNGAPSLAQPGQSYLPPQSSETMYRMGPR